MTDDHPLPDEDPLSRVPVFLYNMSEDVWPFINAIENDKSRESEIAENSAITDREYVGFCAEHPTGGIFISPSPIDPEFEAYVRELFGTKDIVVWVPKNNSGEISRDVINDNVILQKLVSINSFNFYSYCPSPQVFDLIDKMRELGCVFETPESPDRKAWETVGVWATKGGIRQLAAKWMPDGQMFERVNDAVLWGAEKALKSGVVLKTNKGHSGMGVAIFPPNKDLSKDLWIKEIRAKLAIDNGFWDKFPVVVEDYVEMDKKVAGGVPNVECKVNKEGQVEILYYCGMRVIRGGVFAGVEMAGDIMPKIYREKMAEVGMVLGEAYAKAGYRGYYDVDCLIGTDGRFYVGESNIRRTGGTYAYHIARRLLGADFTRHYYIATRMREFNQTIKSFAEIGNQLNSLRWDQSKGEGIIIISSNLMKLNKFVYIVISHNRSGALALEKAMQERLLLT